MSEPLSPPFRVQIEKLKTLEGKCPGPTAGGGRGRADGKGTSQAQFPVGVCLTSGGVPGPGWGRVTAIFPLTPVVFSWGGTLTGGHN